MAYEIIFGNDAFKKVDSSITVNFSIKNDETYYDDITYNKFDIIVSGAPDTIINIPTESISFVSSHVYAFTVTVANFNWQNIKLKVTPLSGSSLSSYVEKIIPYHFGVKFEKTKSYTNSISRRLVHIPFKLVDPYDSSSVVNHKFEFNHLRIADNQLGNVSQWSILSSDLKDYPFKRAWDRTEDPMEDTIGKPLQSTDGTEFDLWENSSVEYDSVNSTYYLNVPFGRCIPPEVPYVKVPYITDLWNDNSYFLLVQDELQDSSSASGSILSDKAYKIEGGDYYLMQIGLYVSNNNNTYTISAVPPTSENPQSPSFYTWAIVYFSTTSAFASRTISSNDQIIVIGSVFATGANISSVETIESAFSGGYVIGTVSDGQVTGTLNRLTYTPSQSGNENYGGIGPYIDGGVNAGTSTGESLTAESTVGFTSGEYFKEMDAGNPHGSSKSLYFFLGINNDGNLDNKDFTVKTIDAVTKVQVHNVAPESLSLILTGSNGSTKYTGYYKKHGRFFPSEYFLASFSAISEINMTYAITGKKIKCGVQTSPLISGVSYKHIMKVGCEDVTYPLLSDQRLSPTAFEVTLTVNDEAGNMSEKTVQMYYMPKLLRVSHTDLREPDSEYSHIIVASNTTVPEKKIGTTLTRSWNEIWYPETHGSPLYASGKINDVAALRIANPTIDATGKEGPTSAELDKYDRLALDGQVLAKDTEGRYIQSIDDWSRNKKYPARENSRLVGDAYQKYWIIDNSGNPDFQLEFEIFDFSSTVQNYPENLCARYRGDSLSVFDASATGCLVDEPAIDEYGNKHWVLKDSTKLSHLFSLKGSGFNSNNKPTLLDSEIGNELVDTGSGFVCPSITQCSKICIVPFTDFGTDDDSRGSGFKLKAGPSHYDEYYNYDYINDTGEFWLHIAPPDNSNAWTSPDGAKIKYEYYESKADIDYENCIIKLSSRANYPLLATYSHYLYLYNDRKDVSHEYAEYPHRYFSSYPSNVSTSAIMSFVTSYDDLQDYANRTFYVAYSGTEIERIKGTIYDSIDGSSGKLTSYTFDSDTGMLGFTSILPKGRIFADYYYHTFYRLTSDGYGDLYFYGNGILVPAASSGSNSYKDWTYVDLKIVNEGGNTLNEGTLTFLARGYVTKGTVVDTVLDQNRPWDVQEGTTAETVNRTGAIMKSSYAALNTDTKSTPTRENAFNAKASQTCSLGTIEPKGKVFVRVFWCIAQNAQGTAWIDCSRGSKTYSAELSGSYFIFTS